MMIMNPNSLYSQVVDSFVGLMIKASRTRDLRRRGSLVKTSILFTILLEIVICQAQSQNLLHPPKQSMAQGTLQLHYQDRHVIMDNGIVQLTLSNPQGCITGIRYHGIENVLAVTDKEDNRGYWDLVWNFPGKKLKKTKGTLDRIDATKMRVIFKNDDKLEISFSRPWSKRLHNSLPMNIDKRFVMLRNSSGFYTYAIFERLKGWPAVELDNIRVAFRLNKDKFNYMAITDDRQRYMPLPEDRYPPRGQTLAYPEAVRLLNPIEPDFKGEVDDKYAYSMESKDIKVHGWISTKESIGFWQITPSNEFRSAGPLKQFLTSHVGPTNLAIFHSTHYAGADLIIRFNEGEAWKKVFGPVFVYLNSFPKRIDPLLLWHQAKNQAKIEEKKWPYDFISSDDFPSSHKRGVVTGRLLIRDRYINREDIAAKGSYVGLAAPGDVGSWQRECKGYQFWSKTDENGYFTINNVRSGRYNLLNIAPGSRTETGDLVYEPPRDGPTLWEIGFPDRSAAEFYIPDPNPMYVNKLYVKKIEHRYRQYGLWDRYTELYPKEDMIYNVDVDDYTKDWFFMQVPRKLSRGRYTGSTWQIRFRIDENVKLKTKTFKLRIALATSNVADLQVRVNNPTLGHPLFTTGSFGKDNIIARYGIHGLYWLYNVEVPNSSLHSGNNTIYLTQPLALTPFQGLMYDYIRLEGSNAVH